MAAIDVFDGPITWADDPLASHPNLIGTPHIGFVTEDEFEIQFADIFDQVVAGDGVPINMINPEAINPEAVQSDVARAKPEGQHRQGDEDHHHPDGMVEGNEGDIEPEYQRQQCDLERPPARRPATPLKAAAGDKGNPRR